MIQPAIQFILLLIMAIALIFLLSVRYRIPAFYSLMLACLLVGFGLHLPVAGILADMKDGFGNIMKSLGFIIVLGTALGLVLARTGSSKVMADFILRAVGEKNAALGISITGLIVGMPVFCDSGYIVLSGLNLSLSRRSGTPLIITSISLATALLSVHCMIPPHPGASAAAAALRVDYGRLILMGLLVAIPAMLTGYFWTGFAGKKYNNQTISPEVFEDEPTNNPGIWMSFLPVFVPIILIALKSFMSKHAGEPSFLTTLIAFLGDPIIALMLGVVLALLNGRKWKKEQISSLLSDAAEKAGSILVIIGAGGAFGAVLAEGKIGELVSHLLPLGKMGLLFPFLLCSILKTAQGSSTVAIITASSSITPLLPALALDQENGRLLTVLAMGAGSMMISQANDAYFWVIAKFSGLEIKAMLRVYTTATLFMGIVSMCVVYLLSFFLK